MGYDTRFRLKARPLMDEKDPLVEVLGEKPKADKAAIVRKLREIVGYSPLDSKCSWYECDKDMKKLSKLFPNVLFTLEGIGENDDDHWTMYFRKGQSFRTEAVITFLPPPDSFLVP